MTLRRYQAESVEKTLAALERSGSAVLQMPTGAGKTKTATEIIANHDGVVWFLCHRKEIIRQAAKAFRASGIDFGVISPAKDPETEKKYRFEPEKRVQLASVGSIGRRIADLPSPSLVIWDECQHTPADSWRALRDKTLDAKHIGLTATPERLDGTGLRDLFDDMIVGPSIDQLVADGYLSKYRYFAPSEPDLSAARMRGSDYRREDLDKVMNTPVLIGDAVAEYKKSVPGKRALVFAASVDASKALVERFVAEGIPAAHVDGDTPDDERDAAVADLASGEICVLSNVEVFTEGFDIPAIDAVILMRPTRSVRLLLQMIGRALRVAEGKDCAMLFDHAGLYHEHGWFADNWHWSLDGGAAKERRRAGGRGPRKCPECNEVRAEREPVCACGFEFPSGREIGEFDGVLREIRGEVPEGCETQTAAAKRWGVSQPTVRSWVERGAPNVDGFPVSATIDSWVRENVDAGRLAERIDRNKRRKEGVVRKGVFAKRIGVPISAVTRWANRGMPLFGDMVPLAHATTWVRANVDLNDPVERQGIADTEGFLTKASFARAYNVGETTVSSWVKNGLPLIGVLIPEAEGREWVEKNVDLESPFFRRSKSHSDGDDLCSISAFSASMGVGRRALNRLVEKGMPLSGRMVSRHAAMLWMLEHRIDINEYRAKTRKKPPTGCAYAKSFARHIGVASEVTVLRLATVGLPMRDGFVVVDEATAWLAENSHLVDDIMTAPNSRATRKRFLRGDIESVKSFSERWGLNVSSVKYWKEKGWLPCDGKFIRLPEADNFVRMHVDLSASEEGGRSSLKSESKYFFAGKGDGRESAFAFDMRLGVRRYTAHYLKKHGLPYDPNLGIPIREALEWVRENRPDIVIPPEAWPADNDNEATTKAA